MSDPLAILEEERDNILLAEIGAMIHNLGKLSKDFLLDQKFEVHHFYGGFLHEHLQRKPEQEENFKKHLAHLKFAHQNEFYPPGVLYNLKSLHIDFKTPPFNDRTYQLHEFSSLIIKELYEKKKGKLDNLLGQSSYLGKVLEAAHSQGSGSDKGYTYTLKGTINQQTPPDYMHLSTAFGHEIRPFSQSAIERDQAYLLLRLQTDLKKLHDFLCDKRTRPQYAHEWWKQFLKEFHLNFRTLLRGYLAETRYPVNDVDLYSFHQTIASFFKTGIAKILLEQPAELEYEAIDKFQWRLLSIRYNGLDYLMQAQKINDMLGKQTVLNNALDDVRWFLEVEYPIANEIYRDENGAAFLFPDIADKNRRKEVENVVNAEIKRIFQQGVNNDLQPCIAYTKSSRQALALGEVITTHTPKFNQVAAALDSGTPEHGDLCQSCNLRFIGHGVEDKERKKARERKLCGVCYQRRDTRAANWWKQERHKTIWMNEVADDYGQVALIVGKFGLEHWLDGWWLNSMLVKTFREVDERIKEISNKIDDEERKYWESVLKNYEKELIKTINRLFQPNATSTLRPKIVELIDNIKVILSSFSVGDVKSLLQSISKNVEALKLEFASHGIDISYSLEIERLNDSLETQLINYSFFKSITPYVSFDVHKAFSNKIDEFDKYLKEEKDCGDIFQKTDTCRFFFLNVKPPSFARISRIWQQTKAFNQAIPGWLERCFQAHTRSRLFIEAKDKNNGTKDRKFKTTHIYEFPMGGADVSLYCVKGSEKDNTDLQFVSATNLGYLQEAFHLDLAACINKDKPEATDKDEKLKAQFTSAEPDKQSYFPYIDILAEPQMFMLLVPAAQAIEVTNLIKARYDEEFSKVKNRLPLNIGVVFAKRRQPLYTMIEAGRKMLDGFENMPEKQPEESEKQPVLWKIAKDVETVPGKPQRFKLTFEHAKRSGRDNEGYMRQLEWEVSAELGDPSKTDYYYPYFYTNFTEEKDVQGRVNIFKAPLTKDDSDWHYLCHVSELKKDDEVYVTPSLFDFEFLEVPGRRFDLYYEHNMRTRDHQHSRPFLLDDIKQLQRVWELLTRKGMTNAKFRGLLEVIEKQRESWFGAAHLADSVGDESFKKFVEYTFWTQAKAWYGELSSDDRALILRYAVNGRLADVSELFMKILKQSIEEE